MITTSLSIRQFHQNVAQVHERLGVHAWVEKAAVEPELHGLGIGQPAV